MKTKVQIVQELLDKRAITAEEAVILLQNDIQYIYQPYYPPTAPLNPYWYQYPSICDTNTLSFN